MSSSAGFLIEDHFAFPDDKGPVRLVFGCEADETGEIFRQQADGILGMGNNNNAFQSQVRRPLSTGVGGIWQSQGARSLGQSLPVSKQGEVLMSQGAASSLLA